MTGVHARLEAEGGAATWLGRGLEHERHHGAMIGPRRTAQLQLDARLSERVRRHQADGP
eukprot:CAMPEP_0183376696 /NCGR_PEP_ID=MMETSP0164_2-20130417/121033_1 /TAXON_ID=221442 /ORGANISM="Coccolithus pelagicus ssp braarudi, Strain PLY182g" /LENGTH=58 /DNA_ID=CAMNT_0025554053 /DNA_START=165 /DNA_END=341 /DNA_ORIENTATION=-